MNILIFFHQNIRYFNILFRLIKPLDVVLEEKNYIRKWPLKQILASLSWHTYLI